MTIDSRLDRALDIYINLLAEKNPSIDGEALKELVTQAIESKGCDVELSNSLSDPLTQKTLLQLVIGAQTKLNLAGHPSLEFDFDNFSKDLLTNHLSAKEEPTRKEKMERVLDASLNMTLPIALSNAKTLQNTLQPILNASSRSEMKKEKGTSSKTELKVDFDDSAALNETFNYTMMFGATPNGSPVLILSQATDSKGASLQTGSIRLGAVPAGILSELEKLAEDLHPKEIREDFARLAAKQNLTPPGPGLPHG